MPGFPPGRTIRPRANGRTLPRPCVQQRGGKRERAPGRTPEVITTRIATRRAALAASAALALTASATAHPSTPEPAIAAPPAAAIAPSFDHPPAPVTDVGLTALAARARHAAEAPAARTATARSPRTEHATTRTRTVRRPAAHRQQPRPARRPATAVNTQRDRTWAARTEKKRTTKRTPARRAPKRQHSPGGASAVVAFAYAQIGDPYQYGSSGPDAWDCSGLAGAAWRQAGKKLPRTTGDISRAGRSVSRADLRPGDLVFPQSGHVAIYVGGGEVIHAPQPGMNVQKSDLWAFSYARRP